MTDICLNRPALIDRIETKSSYEEFYFDYLVKNKPCILTSEWTRDWSSRRLWVKEETGEPDIEYLKNKYGSSIVPIANCNEKQYDAQVKSSMRFDEYLNLWENGIAKSECLYLKDWHWIKNYPEDLAYKLPEYFSSDWLNEYCIQHTNDDYRFVYMGPEGSWTPFHADVFRSHSWSANICGRKKWFLCPPGCEQTLRDKHGNLPYNLSKSVNHEFIIEVEQKAGEIIFIPSCWYHQVHNLEDTISINHNWFNGSNINRVYQFLIQSFEEVQREISNCKEMEFWDEQCQLILKASQGMDFADFGNLLEQTAKSRIISDNKITQFEFQKIVEIATCLLEHKYCPTNVQEQMREIVKLQS